MKLPLPIFAAEMLESAPEFPLLRELIFSWPFGLFQTPHPVKKIDIDVYAYK